jgi:hypothetical protein
MFHYTEEKFQGWRALAVLEDGSQRLLYVGRSTTQVRDGYAAAFAELLDEGERGRVRSIALEHWQGVADQGCWVARTPLAIPAPAGAAAALSA